MWMRNNYRYKTLGFKSVFAMVSVKVTSYTVTRYGPILVITKLNLTVKQNTQFTGFSLKVTLT